MDPMRVIANVLAGKQLSNIGRTDNHPVRAGYPRSNKTGKGNPYHQKAARRGRQRGEPVKRLGKLKALVGVVDRLGLTTAAGRFVTEVADVVVGAGAGLLVLVPVTVLWRRAYAVERIWAALCLRADGPGGGGKAPGDEFWIVPPGGHGLQLHGASFDQKTSATWPRTALTAL